MTAKMTAKPQFEHKKPRLSERLSGSESALRRHPTTLYNAAVISSTCESWMFNAWTFKVWGNDVLSFGLMALLDCRAGAGCGSGHIRIRQMGIPQ
jgi:hypothetical protein